MSKKWFHDYKLATSYYDLVKNVLLPNATEKTNILYLNKKIEEYESYWNKNAQ